MQEQQRSTFLLAAQFAPQQVPFLTHPQLPSTSPLPAHAPMVPTSGKSSNLFARYARNVSRHLRACVHMCSHCYLALIQMRACPEPLLTCLPACSSCAKWLAREWAHGAPGACPRRGSHARDIPAPASAHAAPASAAACTTASASAPCAASPATATAATAATTTTTEQVSDHGTDHEPLVWATASHDLTGSQFAHTASDISLSACNACRHKDGRYAKSPGGSQRETSRAASGEDLPVHRRVTLQPACIRRPVHILSTHICSCKYAHLHACTRVCIHTHAQCHMSAHPRVHIHIIRMHTRA